MGLSPPWVRRSTSRIPTFIRWPSFTREARRYQTPGPQSAFEVGCVQRPKGGTIIFGWGAAHPYHASHATTVQPGGCRRYPVGAKGSLRPTVPLILRVPECTSMYCRAQVATVSKEHLFLEKRPEKRLQKTSKLDKVSKKLDKDPGILRARTGDCTQVLQPRAE